MVDISSPNRSVYNAMHFSASRLWVFQSTIESKSNKLSIHRYMFPGNVYAKYVKFMIITALVC